MVSSALPGQTASGRHVGLFHPPGSNGPGQTRCFFYPPFDIFFKKVVKFKITLFEHPYFVAPVFRALLSLPLPAFPSFSLSVSMCGVDTST